MKLLITDLTDSVMHRCFYFTVSTEL